MMGWAAATAAGAVMVVVVGKRGMAEQRAEQSVNPASPWGVGGSAKCHCMNANAHSNTHQLGPQHTKAGGGKRTPAHSHLENGGSENVSSCTGFKQHLDLNRSYGSLRDSFVFPKHPRWFSEDFYREVTKASDKDERRVPVTSCRASFCVRLQKSWSGPKGSFGDFACIFISIFISMRTDEESDGASEGADWLRWEESMKPERVQAVRQEETKPPGRQSGTPSTAHTPSLPPICKTLSAV